MIKLENKTKIPYVLYLYLHLKIYQKTKGNHLISIKDAKSYLHEWRLPKKIRTIVIKEMELMGLVQKTNKNILEVKRPLVNIDIYDNYFKVMQQVGIILEE